MKQHCKNCFCLTEDCFKIIPYKIGTKVRLLGDKFVGEIRNLCFGLRYVRYSIIYPGHEYCVVASHDSIEIFDK